MKQRIMQASASICSAAVILGASAGPDQAPLGSGAALVESCRPSSSAAPEQAGLCEGFLLGFLEANPEVVFSEQLPSGYMQRVMRTRAPVHPQTASMKTPIYCIEGAESVASLRADIARLDPANVREVPASSVVQGLLEARYRCSS